MSLLVKERHCSLMQCHSYFETRQSNDFICGSVSENVDQAYVACISCLLLAVSKSNTYKERVAKRVLTFAARK